MNQIDRLIEIIDLINDGKKHQIVITMGEAFNLKEFLYKLKERKEVINES